MKQKKNNEAKLSNKRSSYFAIGLLFSLSITLAAFEYRSIYEMQVLTGDLPEIFEDEVIPVYIEKKIRVKPKPIPKQLAINLFLIDNEPEEELSEIEVIEFEPEEKIRNIDLSLFTNEVEPDEPSFFRIVEEMPEFPGGEEALLKFLGKNTNYPAMAVDGKISGTVHVEFIVDENGKVKDVKLKNSIGGGCDEEALRVISSLPNWKPGKQRGKNVKVMFTLPINFILRSN